MISNRAYILSAIVHLLVLGLFFAPMMRTPRRISDAKMVTVQVVQVKDKTSAPKKQTVKKQKKIPKSKNAKAKKNIQKKALPETKPLKKSIPLPTPKKRVAPKKKIEPKKSTAAKPAEKSPTVTKKKVPEDDFLSVLKTVEDLKTPQKKEIEKPDPEMKTAEHIDDVLSLSEMDALRQQLRQCWSVPAGAKGASDLIIEIEISVGLDREVKRAIIVNQSRRQQDPFFRAAADSARRALLHPDCTPLRLPKEKFDAWKETKIIFNPKEMFE